MRESVHIFDKFVVKHAKIYIEFIIYNRVY